MLVNSAIKCIRQKYKIKITKLRLRSTMIDHSDAYKNKIL